MLKKKNPDLCTTPKQQLTRIESVLYLYCDGEASSIIYIVALEFAPLLLSFLC